VSVVSVMCFHVEDPATGLSLVQRSQLGVVCLIECDRETFTVR